MIFLSSISVAHYMELTTLQLGYPSFGALGLRNIKKLEAFKSDLYSKLVEGYSKEVACDNPFCEDCN